MCFLSEQFYFCFTKEYNQFSGIQSFIKKSSFLPFFVCLLLRIYPILRDKKPLCSCVSHCFYGNMEQRWQIAFKTHNDTKCTLDECCVFLCVWREKPTESACFYSHIMSQRLFIWDQGTGFVELCSRGLFFLLKKNFFFWNSQVCTNRNPPPFTSSIWRKTPNIYQQVFNKCSCDVFKCSLEHVMLFANRKAVKGIKIIEGGEKNSVKN